MDSKEYRDLLRKLDEVLGPDGTEALLKLIDLKIAHHCPQKRLSKSNPRINNYWLFIWLILLLSALAIILHII